MYVYSVEYMSAKNLNELKCYLRSGTEVNKKRINNHKFERIEFELEIRCNA